MKKIIAVAVLLAITFSLVGCSQPRTHTQYGPETVVTNPGDYVSTNRNPPPATSFSFHESRENWYNISDGGHVLKRWTAGKTGTLSIVGTCRGEFVSIFFNTDLAQYTIPCAEAINIQRAVAAGDVVKLELLTGTGPAFWDLRVETK